MTTSYTFDQMMMVFDLYTKPISFTSNIFLTENQIITFTNKIFQ